MITEFLQSLDIKNLPVEVNKFSYFDLCCSTFQLALAKLNWDPEPKSNYPELCSTWQPKEATPFEPKLWNHPSWTELSWNSSSKVAFLCAISLLNQISIDSKSTQTKNTKLEPNLIELEPNPARNISTVTWTQWPFCQVLFQWTCLTLTVED